VAIVGAHRRGLLPVSGGFHNGQRFAIDFSARLDAAGRTHVGDADQNTSYFNYGQPLLAVATGTVVEAVDRYPDQIPNHNVPVSWEADGNHVIIALDEGIFAGYAHLKPGSVRVHRGQRVRRGQVLGLLGNSGNTTGAIEATTSRAMSVANFVEVSIIIESRFGADAQRDLDTFIERAGIELAAVDLEQANVARRAFTRFGKGRHPAGLNYGDCFAYALATVAASPCSTRVTTSRGPT